MYIFDLGDFSSNISSFLGFLGFWVSGFLGFWVSYWAC
jgi:hypothetical protein